jgi:hypothetical protein
MDFTKDDVFCNYVIKRYYETLEKARKNPTDRNKAEVTRYRNYALKTCTKKLASRMVNKSLGKIGKRTTLDCGTLLDIYESAREKREQNKDDFRARIRFEAAEKVYKELCHDYIQKQLKQLEDDTPEFEFDSPLVTTGGGRQRRKPVTSIRSRRRRSSKQKRKQKSKSKSKRRKSRA